MIKYNYFQQQMSVLLLMALVLGLLILTGCNTQATMMEGEPYPCFNIRFLAREKQQSDSMAIECVDNLKYDRCMKALKERPEVFRDFNDCWSKGK